MALSRVQFFALVVVSVVQDCLQLSRASGLVQEVFSKAFALLRKLLVLLSELILHLGGMRLDQTLRYKTSVLPRTFCCSSWLGTEQKPLAKKQRNDIYKCWAFFLFFSFYWQWTQLEEIYNHTDLTELFEFPAQSKGCEDGILAGQCNERWGGQSLVDVETRPRMSKAVNLWEQRD